MDANEKLVSDSSTGDFTISGPDMSGRRMVAALFATQDEARGAIDELHAAGFGEDCVGVVARESEPGPVVDTETPVAGATSGAVSGGLVGGLVGAIVGIGLMAVPGLGWVAAGGALATMLAGAGVGAVGGGVIGALTSLGISEDTARSLEAGINAGHVLVTVNTNGRTETAVEILSRHNGDLGPYRIGDAPTEGCSDSRATLM